MRKLMAVLDGTFLGGFGGHVESGFEVMAKDKNGVCVLKAYLRALHKWVKAGHN